MSVEYHNRTGRDPGRMTIPQLRFAMGVFREQDRLQRLDMAHAVSAAISAAFGNQKAFDSL